MKNDRNFSGSKIVIITNPRQLCVYKVPAGSRKFKLHFHFQTLLGGKNKIMPKPLNVT